MFYDCNFQFKHKLIYTFPVIADFYYLFSFRCFKILNLIVQLNHSLQWNLIKFTWVFRALSSSVVLGKLFGAHALSSVHVYSKLWHSSTNCFVCLRMNHEREVTNKAPSHEPTLLHTSLPLNRLRRHWHDATLRRLCSGIWPLSTELP